MLIKSIKVSNVSLGATERDIMEFFSFSGDIEYVELQSHDERSQIAYVTFKDSQGAETAVLLSGATIVDLSVNITPDPDYRIPATALASSTTVGKTPGGAESALWKAKDVVTNMLAKGFILGKDAVNKAKTFDEKLQITSTASAKLTSFDQKLGLSEKISAGASVVSDRVREVDQKFQVSEKTKSAFAVAEQKVSTAGSAIMKNRYVLTGTSWVTGAFNRVAKAAGDVGQKTKEKVENAEEEHKRKVEDQFAQVLSESPKAAIKSIKVSNVSVGASERDIMEFFSFSGDIEYVELQRSIKSIKVSNVSLGATERDIMEFFSFSGDIEYVELQSHDERSQIAYVTFKDSQGAETAVLLSGATIVDLSVNITPDPDYRIPATALASSTTVGKTPGGAESALWKAKDVVTNMLAKGFILGKDAVNKAKTFDEKLQITSTASAKLTSFDQKLGLSEKISAGASVVSDRVREVDQKFQVSEKTKSAFAVAEQKVSTAGSAIMKNRYVLTGTSWVTGAFNRVAKAAGDVGQKTKEKVENAEEEHKRKVEDQFAQVLSESPKAAIKSIKVSNVSVGASERDIMEFFSFSGDIEYVELQSHDEQSQIAYVTFKDSQGAETAVLLSGATIVDLSVNITLDPDYRIPATALASSTTVGKTPGGAESALRKAKDVVTSMLAKGFILVKDAVNKAKTFDEKLQITSTASAKLTSFDQKLGLSEKISAGASVVSDRVREVDQKFQVSEKTKSAFAVAEQKVSTAGSAIMKNRYVLTGTSWVTGAFNRVAKAAGDVGQKTKERVENTEEEQKRKVEDHQYAQVLSKSPKAAVVESPNYNSNSRNAKAFSPIKKFLMQSYYDRHTNLHDSDFENFMSQEVPFGLCDALPNNHNFLLRPSVLKRNLIGEGSHRSVSTLIKFQTQQSKSLSELLSYSCEFIIIERLSSGVFADPFELQRLVQRGVFNDIAVFGDTNLELPSFLSNRSAVEIHLDVDPNILLEPSDIKIELPLHARYQPLNESGYSTVEFGAPDMLVRCSTKENVENRNCFFKLKIDDANLYDAGIVWSIPSGRKVHAEIVSGVTFIAALLSTLVIVVTCYIILTAD